MGWQSKHPSPTRIRAFRRLAPIASELARGGCIERVLAPKLECLHPLRCFLRGVAGSAALGRIRSEACAGEGSWPKHYVVSASWRALWAVRPSGDVDPCSTAPGSKRNEALHLPKRRACYWRDYPAATVATQRGSRLVGETPNTFMRCL